MALDKQISLFRVDTNAFLTEDEKKHYNDFQSKLKGYKDEYKKDKNKEKYNENVKTEKAQYKEFILQSAAKHVADNNKAPRILDESYLSYTDKETGEIKINKRNIVSMFESTLSRSFNIPIDSITYDIFIVEIYYYDIAKDLIINGFDYNGRHFIYFSSSAGQIRTKKAVFVDEEKYKLCEKKLMCGLTVDHINEQGGMNVNKYLAYLALSNSATDLWEDIFGVPFDIDRCIVVDDFETYVPCTVDYIDYKTYNITPNVDMEIPIPHTDGCGMIDSHYCNKNFMVRLPFIKGLLGSFDFKKFIIENNCSPIVKDIWGQEYNILEDDIQIIFTKSQLKMHKYYSSWDEYKGYFKEYGCEAGICNMEENHIPNAKINYQMLQTLYKATPEDIKEMCEIPNKKISEICDKLSNALEFFGVYTVKPVEEYDDYFQKALKIYPELLSDPASRADLRDLKNSRVKKYRSGKLDVVGKFTFVLPDLYAFCQWLFMKQEVPVGLLANDEVYCRLYSQAKELDCLRSPHLYIEHAIRNNVCGKIGLCEWFNTDAIYISTHDPISRILQLDVDGDRLLVLAQKQIINLAKKCMEGVNPLYYEMHKANAELITPENLYKGLELAFTGGRIGGISNDITKIWNCGKEISDEAKNAVKWLCLETNYTINKSVA